MESQCQLFGILIFVGFGLLNVSHTHPIGETRGSLADGDGSSGGGFGGAGAWLSGVFWPSLMGVAVLVAAGGAALVGCCACCRKSPKGFQEFTDSGSSHSLSTGGYVNPAASSASPANEFTIFPPAAPVLSGGGGPVSFEPLPDIRPRQTHGSPTSSTAPSPTAAVNPSHATTAAPTTASRRRSSQKKPAAFNNAVSHGLSAQDWFDDPHDNFPRSQLKYLCEFGKGWFGRVVEGEALGLVGSNNINSPPITPTRVVVKILHGDATPTDQMYFLHEVRFLRDLTPHPNILQLLGRCLETDPFLIILEACPNGDLKTFLLQNLATAEALSMQGVILRMACNVAAGLQYMHERGFVHTDLAARNCLVAPDLTVKIGDYGTSIENFKDDYYCAGDVALPIRWCAPETLHCTDTTIETKEVTVSANIWSLGILLWEVCEFGRLPYSELNDEEVIVKVLSEKSLHLGPPSRSCLHANNLYHLMRLCWNPDNKRPGITQVAAMLNNLYLHPEELPSSSVEDFEHRWAITKPNGVMAIVETIVHEPPLEMQQKAENEDDEEEVKRENLEIIQRNLSPSPHPSLHCEPLSPTIKHKSPSLQNLRGSLEDLIGCSSLVEEGLNKEVCSSVCELDISSCDMPIEAKSEVSWLHHGDSQGVTEDDEDAQFVRKISEAIRDLDDVLALEKTSSSSGSGTSPEEHSPTKKRFSQQAHDKVDENGVLDFRLGHKSESIDKSETSTDNVSKRNMGEYAINNVQMDSLQWDVESVQDESEKTSSVDVGIRSTEENVGQSRGRQELNQVTDGIEWKVGICSNGEELDNRIEKPKTAMEVAQEEEEEAWRQRVERGEFTAKVREKSRSVQDLMVLTHIEDSSEGSDSEGGVVSHGKCTGSPPPGPLLPSTAVPSFGSVGDLRTAVLGEEFRHTLERLCAANKRCPPDQTGSSLKNLHPKLSEEPEEKRENVVEVSKEFDEQAESFISSQNEENLECFEESYEMEPNTVIHKLPLVDSSIKSQSSPTSTESVNFLASEDPSKDFKSRDDAITEKIQQEVRSPLTTQCDKFSLENSKNSSGIVTSTPFSGAFKRLEITNDDSFIFDLTPVGPTFPGECVLKQNNSNDSSVSTVDPTFPESDESVNNLVNTEVNSQQTSVSDAVGNINSENVMDIKHAANYYNKNFNVDNLCKVDASHPSNAQVEYPPLENMDIDDDEDEDDRIKENFNLQSSLSKVIELSAELPLTFHNSIVNHLSVLDEESLMESQLQSRLNDNTKNATAKENELTNVPEILSAQGEHSECIGLAVFQEKDDKNIDHSNAEKCPQDSPMNEFPGEGEEQSPLHGLSCGISGSQSTVECRSPLALSPVTVGIEDILTPTSAVTSFSSKELNTVIQSSNDASPCDEKFKREGVTKEINSDFIFTVDATVENMDAVVKPDLLLDSERVPKELSFDGSKVPPSLLDTSNIGNQDNMVETLISTIEVDRNCDNSWIKPHSIDKDIESSHILLDLVQINSNGLQNLSNDANILSSIIDSKEVVSSVEKQNNIPAVSEFSPSIKDYNHDQKNQVIEKEFLAMEKESVMSDAPNSEECDSAGTEDSVFDFSPPIPGNGSAPVEVEGIHIPRVKQIRFLSEGEEGFSRFGNGKNNFDSVELKDCTGGEEEDVESQGAEGGREDDEDEELGLLGTKQWTPDDERSSDSGFRDKGSLSESVEDACERCDLADVETGVEEEEMGIGGGEATAEGDVSQVVFISCDYPEEINGEGCIDENVEHKNSELHYPGTSSEENSFSSSTRGEGRGQDDFWRQQIASLRHVAGDRANFLREASAPTEHSSWIEGEAWDEDAGGNAGDRKISESDGGDRGLDEASLAALRSELQEKLGGSNSRFGSGIDNKREDGSFERANSEERLSDEDEEDGEEMNEERTDITIHYDAYLAQLSPILEERESVGSSELYSPATKELPRDSVSDDSATTASVNDIGDNHVFSSDSNIKDPGLAVEDVLIVDTSTNQASLMVSSPIDFQENDGTSPEFTDSLEDDDDDEDNKVQIKSDQLSPKNLSEFQKEEASPKVGSSASRYVIPPSDFWSSINNLASPGGQVRPSIGSPLLLPPPPSSAPMPSPEEERAGCVERDGTNKIPMFRDFEDIVALCQSQGDDFAGCDEAALDGLRSDSQRSSEETDIQNMGTTTNLPFWESESSDGNDSSSSGEFVWKEGERDNQPARSGDVSLMENNSQRVYESLSEFPMAVIEEEDEDEAGEGEDGKEDGASDSSGSVMEFIPSAWNSSAEPSRSSLRSPDRKSEQKKNVSFKRQKYHCVYEYPKEEASDSEGEGQDSPTRKRWDVQQQAPPFDYSSYADWELMEGDIPEGIIPGDVEVESELPNAAASHRQFDFYKLSSEDYDFGFATVTPEVSDGEFMVSSSSRPFQYCTSDSPFTVGSQFFPGISLSASNMPGWVAGRRSPWSKSGEENMDMNENITEEVKVGDTVPDILADAVPQDVCHVIDRVCSDKLQKSTDGGTLEWSSSQQPLPSPAHSSSSSSASLSSCSPPASPLSPTGLGELRHTRDRLKLDLPHKFSLSEVARAKSVRKEMKTVESVETGGKIEREGGSVMTVEEVKEMKVKRRAAEEQRGEASLLDVEKEREGITKTAL